jgi:hypothetical protein
MHLSQRPTATRWFGMGSRGQVQTEDMTMSIGSGNRSSRTVGGLFVVFQLLPGLALATGLELGSEEIVKAGGIDLTVPGYSVPAWVDWNSDGLCDLLVGEGGNGFTGKVRVYLNSGVPGGPMFTTYFYVQSNGVDLTVPPVGCLGAFPRCVYWDADQRKDLLVGQADGLLKLYTNIGTDAVPTFDGGTFLQVGQPGSKVNIDVGDRAAPAVVDWNSDGRKDLAVGGLDGKIHLFINQGSDAAPDFLAQTFAQNSGVDLLVPTGRSSPVVLDLDHDGKKDLLTGNTEGQLLLYVNTGTDAAPSFSGYVAATSDDVPINLPGTLRSRPSICDWTGDGVADVLVGYGDGKVHLYRGILVGDLNCDGEVDFGDINPFVLYLSDFTAWQAAYPGCPPHNGDINGDGSFPSFGDINPFVALLSGG